MVDRLESGEYSRSGGVLATGVEGHSSYAETNADNRGVKEAAMVLRRAGLRASDPEVVETYSASDRQITRVVTPYDEVRARAELEEKH